MTAAGTVPGAKLRVLVVDDHDVVHWGFRVLLAEQPWVERCAAARTSAEALKATERLHPDVALVDLFLAGESGAELCQAIRAAFKAVDAGKQVAVLVPTTILAEQHHRNFASRMAEFPFHV